MTTTITSVAIRPAVNGYIVTCTTSTPSTLTPPGPPVIASTEILFTDLTAIGTFLTQQGFVPLTTVVATPS